MGKKTGNRTEGAAGRKPYDIHIAIRLADEDVSAQKSAVEETLRKAIATRTVWIGMTKGRNMQVYIKLNTRAHSLLEKGPSDAAEQEEFENTHGLRAERRKFRDGTTRCVLTFEKFSHMPSIIPYYIMYNALKTNNGIQCFTMHEPILDFMVTQKQVVDSKQIVQTGVDVLNEIREFNLPLQIVESNLTSETVRNTSVHSTRNRISLVLADSEEWPLTQKEVYWIKMAYLAAIGKKLNARYMYKTSLVVQRYGIDFEIVAYAPFDMCAKNADAYRKWCAEQFCTEFHQFVSEYTAKTPFFANNVKILKTYLARHGFYPLETSDVFVETIAFLINRKKNFVSPGRFFTQFLLFDFDEMGFEIDMQTEGVVKTDAQNVRFVCRDRTKRLLGSLGKITRHRLVRLNSIVFENVQSTDVCDARTICDKTHIYSLFRPEMQEFDFVLSAEWIENAERIKYKKGVRIFVKNLQLTLERINIEGVYILFDPVEKRLMAKVLSEDTDVKYITALITFWTLGHFNWIRTKDKYNLF